MAAGVPGRFGALVLLLEARPGGVRAPNSPRIKDLGLAGAAAARESTRDEDIGSVVVVVVPMLALPAVEPTTDGRAAAGRFEG